MVLAPRRLVLLTAALWVPLLVWWAALLPGGLSNDSFNSWTQIKTGHWESHHPPPFTALFWLTSLGGTTPATTSLVQTVLVAAALAWFAAALGHVLNSGRATWFAAAFLAMLPLVGPFSVTIWKDVPETAALLVVSGLLLAGWDTAEPVARSWWVALAASALAVGLLRWNGGATTVVAALVVVVGLRGAGRWWAALTLAAAGMAGFGFLLLLPHVTSVTPIQPIDSKADQLADLAQFARNTPQGFSAVDRAVMERVAPFGQWARAAYTCVSVDPVTYNLIRYHNRVPALDAQATALSAVWSRVAKKEPAELLHARACRASLAWSLADPPRRVILTTWPRVNANRYRIHQLSPEPVRTAARRAALVSQRRWVQELFWRPALWVLLTIGAALLTGVRSGRVRRLLLVLAVPLGVLVSYAAQPAAQDARYTYASTIICQLSVVGYVAAWISGRRSGAAKSTHQEGS